MAQRQNQESIETAVLRAEAPIFVPCFALPIHETQQIYTTEVPKDVNTNKKYRRKRQTKKKKPDTRTTTTEKKTKKNLCRRNHKHQYIRSTNKEPSLSLEQEKSFPSLIKHQTSSTINSIWSSAKPSEIFHLPLQQQDKEETSSDDNFFSRRGLQRLTKEKKTANSPPKQQIPKTKANNETEAVDPSLQNRPRRRQRLPMDRLRDRWWDTLTRRRLRSELMRELSLRLQERMVDPDDEDSSQSSTSTEAFNLELVVTAPMDYNNPQDYPSDTRKTSSLSAIHERLSTTNSIDSLNRLLKDIIDRSDGQALQEILKELQDISSSPITTMKSYDVMMLQQQAIQLCVQQDKPHLLRVILKYTATHINHKKQPQKQAKTSTATATVTPLMIAAKLGNKECLSLLLSTEERHSNTLCNRDKNGETVFHYCCHTSNNESTLRVLLQDFLSSSVNKSKWKYQWLPKLLLTQNKQGHQTPLHIACQQGRVELVEIFLNLTPKTILHKLLSCRDVLEQTPLLAAVAANAQSVVLCLILWRGGNHRHLSDYQSHNNTIDTYCPLEWSAKHGNLEMIQLLLQFSTSSEYRVTEAISALLQSQQAEEDVKIDGMRVLLQAGGNPFLSCCRDETSAVIIACFKSSTKVLKALIKTGHYELKTKQQQRRRDPMLQKQPETYFQAIEATENSQLRFTLKQALIECLVRGHYYNNESQNKHLESAIILYQHGTILDPADLIRLIGGAKSLCTIPHSLEEENIVPLLSIAKQEDDDLTTTTKRCFVATYHHNYPSDARITMANEMDRSQLSYNSRLLCQMPWLKECVKDLGSCCPWISAESRHSSASTSSKEHGTIQFDKVLLITSDEQRFLVHGSIMAAKSAKLASAIRFAKISHREEIPEIRLEMDAHLCKLLLQHLYHGSIVSLLKEGEQLCRDLLSLMWVAEESLCPSLIQECELRLLSSDPRKCCLCWSCCKTVRPSPSLNDEEKDSDLFFAECMVCVEGPSLLITGSSALDVLAMSQYFLESSSLMDKLLAYQIDILAPASISIWTMPPSKALSNNTASSKNSTTRASAIHSLKDIAIQSILFHFAEVIRSQAFSDSIDWNIPSTEQSEDIARFQQILLLQTCLEDFLNSCLPTFLLGRYCNGGGKMSLT
jgi:ankyrin repeat protein